MKNILAVIFVFLIGGFACSKNDSGTTPDESPDLSNLQLSMHKFGGWIPSSILEMYQSGWVEAQEILQSYPTTLDTGFARMTCLEKQTVEIMLDAFSDFDSAYSPQHYRTDQEYYYLVSFARQPPDTTSVYDLSEVVIPDELRQGIKTLEQIYERAIPSNRH